MRLSPISVKNKSRRARDNFGPQAGISFSHPEHIEPQKTFHVGQL